MTNLIEFVESGVPFIKSESVINGKINFETIAFITEAVHRQLTKSFVFEGDILFTKIGAIGRVAVYDGRLGICNSNAATAKIQIDSSKANSKFVAYQLSSERVMRKFARTIISTPPRINLGDINSMRIEFPSLPEQKKIAKILQTIDRTITHTEALIEKYQQIKAGLMHDLFTRGIGADGKLRPTRDQAPELYQESSIGWIPKEWKFEALNYGLIASPKNGYSPKEVENWQDVYVLGLGCLTRNGFSPIQLKNAPRNSLFSGAKLEDGDFLISRSNTQELVGLCGIYRDIGHNVIYPDLMIKLKFNRNLVSEFLEKYLLSKAARQRISAIAVGTSGSMVKINATTLKALKVIYPKPDEQLKIVAKLEPIENQISCLKIQFDKLKKQKSGLMHDLLTGTVGVNIDPV
jgi:type I restriction enzyme S subunit